MAVLLLLLMAYSLVGEVLHEWMGVSMLALFVLQHIWNRAWYKSIGRGRLSPYQAVQTARNLLLFAVVLGMLLSGLILSQHILDFLPLQRGETIARTLHLPLAYWRFLLMSLHLGLHWSGIMNTVRQRLHIQDASRFRLLLPRLPAGVVVGYGLYAFAYVGAMHDSFPHARKLSMQGYKAFALIYRPGAQTACEDLARAITFIFDHAEELEVDTSCYSLWGGSAGARMAAWLGTYGPAAFGGDDLPQPGAVIMQYTGLGEYSPQRSAHLCLCGRSGRDRQLARHESAAGCTVSPWYRHGIPCVCGSGPRLRPGKGHFCRGVAGFGSPVLGTAEVK